ncbi:MAG: DUF167 domain-containing protein [Anaerolineae bacterium]|nr:DUF167 domain-containing protein [Anaerolineae bacterium]
MPAWIVAEDESGVTIAVQAVPRARRGEIADVHGEALRVRVAAPPVEGAANEALTAFLAERLRVRRREISLVSGERSRRKLVRIRGLDAGEVEARLLAATPRRSGGA